MRASLDSLDVGDRAPDFQLPDQQGQPLRFYEKILGRPVVLFFFTRAEAPGCQDELAALAAAEPDIEAAGADIFAISRDRVPANAACVEAHRLGFPVLRDPHGKLSDFCGFPERDGRSSGIILLDPNQRVTRVIRDDGGGIPLARRALEHLAGREAPSAPPVIRAQAPVLILPKLLDDNDCRFFIELWRSGEVEEGEVRAADGALRVEKSLKSRRDLFISDKDLNAKLLNVLGRRVAPEIKKAFHYEVACVESYRVVCYDAEHGGYFRPHRDNVTAGQAYRRFAMTLALNDDFEGGALRFPEYGPQLYRPEPGGAVLFSCSLLHEVLDVTAGQRFVMLNFFHGEADERQRQAYLKQAKS